jgi:hypothetical protein
VPETPRYIVTVTDELTPALVEHAGCHYESPPQDEHQARILIRLLLASRRPPADSGPWARPLAGGRRHISLRCAAHRS